MSVVIIIFWKGFARPQRWIMIQQHSRFIVPGWFHDPYKSPTPISCPPGIQKARMFVESTSTEHYLFLVV